MGNELEITTCLDARSLDVPSYARTYEHNVYSVTFHYS